MLKRTATAPESPQPKRRAYCRWAEPFLRGKQDFSCAKYTDAIKHFSDAIAINSTNITLFDCRAACYEKLGQWSDAHRDAMTMIKTSPAQSNGYLRAGKLFSIQKRYSNALAIYNRALKTVPETDSRYCQLVDMRKMVLAQRKQVGIDFLQILPFDIVAQIFELLSFDRRIQCMAVSRSWRGTLKHWPGMWREIDFPAKMSLHTMKKYMSYVKGRYVRKFTLYGNRNRATNMLQLLINRDCQYIQTLRKCKLDIGSDGL